jgi:two-component system chemotaxis response regulator CheB
MDRKQIKVFIVDDSVIARALLSHIIESDPQLKVVGQAGNRADLFKNLEQIKPDIITMDIMMPQVDGFEITKQLMQSYSIPIIIISGFYTKDDVEKSFQAVEAGALDILPKPKGPNDADYDKQAKRIIDSIKVMSQVKVRKKSLELVDKISKGSKLKPSQITRPAPEIRAIAMGASLGGPQALQTIISDLPKTIPVPLFVVQHISPGFVEGLASWLKRFSALDIKIANHNEQAKPGTVYIAPDKFHMEVGKNNLISLVDAPPEHGLKPSVARLFRSMAITHGAHGVGIILTGMGRDGVDDLMLMRKSGALTIAQNKESCIINGMPGEAINIGAAQLVLPLTEIAFTLKSLFRNL